MFMSEGYQSGYLKDERESCITARLIRDRRVSGRFASIIQRRISRRREGVALRKVAAATGSARKAAAKSVGVLMTREASSRFSLTLMTLPTFVAVAFRISPFK
jgi:hypothetical protein